LARGFPRYICTFSGHFFGHQKLSIFISGLCLSTTVVCGKGASAQNSETPTTHPSHITSAISRGLFWQVPEVPMPLVINLINRLSLRAVCESLIGGVVIIHRKGEDGTGFKVAFLDRVRGICKRSVAEPFTYHLSECQRRLRMRKESLGDNQERCSLAITDY
jgi:hypothetical protein